jgi:Spy/CpxP family protein refolding chaperone
MNKRTLGVLAGAILVASMAASQPGPGAGAAAGQEGNRGGYGAGMMGGHGMGYGGMGMMGGYGLGRNIPNLSADQRNKIEAIRRDLRNRQFALMDQMHDQMHSTQYYRNGQFDEEAARRAWESTEKLRRQMFENALDAQKRIDALLTQAQRQQLSRQDGGQ